MWREVPLFQRPDEIAMPYTIKELIYEEVWKALPRQLQDDTVGGKSPEKANPGVTKKHGEHDKGRKRKAERVILCNRKHRKFGAEREQVARRFSARELPSALPIEV